jgi:protein TonB
VVEENPEPPGGMKEFYSYIYDHIQYPAMAKEHNMEGTVYVRFVVQSDGSITDIEVLRGPGGGLDDEAVRVLRNYPKKWKPGKQRGKAVPVYFNLPIKFSLN